jgi:hypothetical protein
MAEQTPEEKAAELEKSFREAEARAAQRALGRPAQLPTNPGTGSDDPDDNKAGPQDGEGHR